MAFLQEPYGDAPPFLTDRRRNPLLRQRQELLVEVSVLALRDSLLDTLLEQAVAGLRCCGGQRSLLLRRRKDECPAVYSRGCWQALQLGPDGLQTLGSALAAMTDRLDLSGLDEGKTTSVDVLALPDDSLLLLVPLLVDEDRQLILGVFVTQLPDEDYHCFLRALSRVLAAALARQEQDLARRAELAHAGRLLLLGEMTSGLIHELNQPLAAIVNYAHGSQRQLEVGAPPPAILRDHLEKIARQACRASELVKRLRRLIRKEASCCVAVDLTRLLEGVVDLCEAEAAKQGVGLKLRLPASALPEVRGDPMQIEQVLLNLLYNAIEAGPHPDLESSIVTIEAQPQGADRVLVRVRDCGPGLPEPDGERLFQSFHTTKPEGLGLGLAISRSLVESQQGQLWAENNPCYGATFNLALPVAKTGAGAP
ncbi:MAG: ATP-binding protein [Candidatus Competibacter sp.]